jgi:hypothetical protein
MIRETRELLAALAAMNEQIPAVCLGILDGSVSAEQQVAFGTLLIELGEVMQRHARTERTEVVEGAIGGRPTDTGPARQRHPEARPKG